MNEAEKLINSLYGKGTIGFTCDNCGRETNGITYVNGMKFCAKCYQETFGKDNQQNEIQQLKQQLEEKNKEIERLCNDCNKLWLSREQCDIDRMKAEINQTQLAIQELEKVKNFIDGRTYCADYINKRIQELKGE